MKRPHPTGSGGHTQQDTGLRADLGEAILAGRDELVNGKGQGVHTVGVGFDSGQLPAEPF